MDIFISSFIAGSLQTIIGHPFDTLKTQIQLNQTNNIIQQIKELNTSRNIFKLYSGAIPALYAGCLQNSLLFTIHQKTYDKTNNHFIAGCIAGSFSTLIVSPLEYIKCNQQNIRNQNINELNKNKLTLNNLFNKNIWKGYKYTLYRDSFGLGIYFYSYHLLEKDYGTFYSGGIAGLVSWIYLYPFDKIKTLHQCNKSNICNSKIITYNNLYKGFSLVAIRSILVNSSLFSVFEYLNNK